MTQASASVAGILAQRPAGDSDGGSGAPTFTPDQQGLVDKICYWLYLPGVNATFWSALDTFNGLMTKNQGIGKVGYWVDTVKTDHAYVYAKDQSRGMFFCLTVYFTDNDLCQREVLLHEYYHFCGCGHHYDASTSAEALACAHHMAELTYDLAIGCTGGCKPAGVCQKTA